MLKDACFGVFMGVFMHVTIESAKKMGQGGTQRRCATLFTMLYAKISGNPSIFCPYAVWHAPNEHLVCAKTLPNAIGRDWNPTRHMCDT